MKGCRIYKQGCIKATIRCDDAIWMTPEIQTIINKELKEATTANNFIETYSRSGALYVYGTNM